MGKPAPDPVKSLRLRHSFRTLNRSVFYPRFAPVQLQKLLGNLLDKLRLVIVHECNGHLEKFSLPQAIKNSRQFVILRKDIFRENISGNKRSENFSLAGSDDIGTVKHARPRDNPCSLYITGL